MERIEVDQFSEYIGWARKSTANRVYPLSIAEGFQSGDIFVDDPVIPRAVLFWHNCGFAYLTGRAEAGFLEEIYDRFMASPADRRFLLITDNMDIISYYSDKPGISSGRRMEYVYEDTASHRSLTYEPSDCRIEYTADPQTLTQKPLDCSKEYTAGHQTLTREPSCCSIKRIDEQILTRLEGRIIPSFSWKEDDRFLEKGFGYAALIDDMIVSTAFSAAVSSEEIDIGVETKEQYRGCGFARILAGRMCRDIIAMGKRPVWAHSQQNTASMSTAEACGFMVDKINIVIKRSEQ